VREQLTWLDKTRTPFFGFWAFGTDRIVIGFTALVYVLVILIAAFRIISNANPA